MKTITAKETLCPSARPEVDKSVAFGVIGGTGEKPHVTYLKQPLPITDDLIAKAAPVTPAEVLRSAAPCATKGCQHFDGANCRLVTQIVEQLPTVTEDLPPCSIRRDCRWWQQEGKSACMRCPQVITDNYNPSELMRQAVAPAPRVSSKL
jgi:hypothetical protein